MPLRLERHAVLDEALDERGGGVRAARAGSRVLDVALWVLELLAAATCNLSEKAYQSQATIDCS